MTERILTGRDLNRALLARQMLLERADVDLPTALERMGGLQAQYAPSMYIGLWSRVRDLHRERVTEALESRTVVQATLLRATIHLVSRRDYWPYEAAVRRTRRDWFLRATKSAAEVAEIESAAERLRDALLDGPLRSAEIDKIVGSRLRNAMGMFLDLVRVPPSGTWERRRADLYGLAEEWVGPCAVTEEDGVRLIVRRYLSAFGPSTRQEIALWAGLPAVMVDEALADLKLRRFRAEDGAELLDLPRAPLPDPRTPAPVRFLPTWDAALLVHARRTGLLPEEYRPRIFHTKIPQSIPTFLVDGSVAGTWRYDKGRVVMDEFHPLDPATRAELRDEAERLSAFHS